MRIIEALLRSAETGRPVKLDGFPSDRRPDPSQEIERPPVREPELVGARSPHTP